MTLSPTKANATNQDSAVLTVTVDTQGHAVNVVQFWLKFPNANLDCHDIRPAATWAIVLARSCTSRAAAFAVMSEPGTSFTGTAAAAAVVLRGAARSGRADVTFVHDKSAVGDVDTGQDILGTTNRAVVVVRNSAS